jgi:chromosome segregation protein
VTSLILVEGGLSAADIGKVVERMTSDKWADLATATPEDLPVFEYRVREGEYIPFREASAGQQATALLSMLLRSPGAPLVIDQPEEDLDNQIMLKIVEQLWDAKRQRQLIFSSHNANFVVNGDAELVLCCENRIAGEQSGGVIRHQGAIDVPQIKEEITRVMEGGADAFKLRQQKYGF